MPWDALAKIYYHSMSSDMGALAIDARIAIGAMIIKHKLKTDDREAIEAIRENMYMEYFPGLSEYKYNDIKESGLEENEEGPKLNTTKRKPKKNKCKLLMDATVADQMIAYPTDLGLLSRSREESERLIDELCKNLDIKHKPRTYRRLTRKQYLNLAKKKNKSKKEIHTGLGQQLRYLKRNLKNIDKLLDKTERYALST